MFLVTSWERLGNIHESQTGKFQKEKEKLIRRFDAALMFLFQLYSTKDLTINERFSKVNNISMLVYGLVGLTVEMHLYTL